MSELLEQIKQMTPEEQAELAAVLDAAQKKAAAAKMPVTEQPCMRNPRYLNENGMPMTAEERWNKDHPLIRKPYGYYENIQVIGQPPRVKVWTKEEVEAYNKPIEEAWLAEKRKLFPDAQLPPNHDLWFRPSKFGGNTRVG